MTRTHPADPDRLGASSSAAGAKTTGPHLPFAVVTKPTGAGCNLDCKYCFFLSKELLYDTKNQQMSEQTLKVYIREFLRARPDGEVTMLWQGGEPTLRGRDFYARAVELCEKYRRPGQQVTHAFQTNATLIDAKWAKFLAEHDFLVGVSLDGPPAYHDVYRVNRAGRATSALVERGWWALQDAGVRSNILCTVHAANQDHGAEVYEYFRDHLGAQFMQFIPIVERVPARYLATAEHGWGSSCPPALNQRSARKQAQRLPAPDQVRQGTEGAQASERIMYQQAGNAVTSRSVDPLKYGRFLVAVFNRWVRADVGSVFVQDFDTALSAFFGQFPTCVHAPNCGNNFAMEFNGDVYACDHWVEPDWKLGNITERGFVDLAATERARQFATKKLDLDGECRTCPFVKLCFGGCPKDRFTPSNSLSEGSARAAGSALSGNTPAGAQGGTQKDAQRGAQAPQMSQLGPAAKREHNYLCAGYRAFYTATLPDFQRMARLISQGQAPALIMQYKQNQDKTGPE